MKKINTYLKLLFVLFLSLVYVSCNPARKLPQDEYLLEKNVIIESSRAIDKTEINNYIRQKPNRKLLGLLRFHLWIYNLVDADKAREKKIKRDADIDAKNAIRAAKGKKPKSKDKFIFKEWLLDIGEAPVVLDSGITKKSISQIQLFLENKGYFNSAVKDSVSVKNKKAIVYYQIKTGKPYAIHHVKYAIEDSLLRDYFFPDTSGTLIKPGDNYDVDVFQKERERITRNLRNNGYYYFSKEYVYFKVDSNLKKHLVNVTLGVKKFSPPLIEGNDSIKEVNHKRYFIKNIFIQTDFNSINQEKQIPDTLQMNDYYLLFNRKLQYKPKVLIDALLLKKNDSYNADNAENTYKRLAELKAFKFINIRFEANSKDSNLLDCYVQLSPVFRQAFTIETEGTNTSGNLGIAGSLVYQNKNIFKGAELLELKLKGGLEAQKQINGQATNELIPLNTIQFGPEANLSFPRPLFPFNLFNYSKTASPKTNISSAVNYQKRPDYTRSIANLSFGLSFKESTYKRHVFIPVEINFVKVDLKENFSENLRKTGNLFLLNSFTDHLTTATRYSFIFNNQDIKKRKNFSYFKVNTESSGNILRGIYNTFDIQAPDADNSYSILNVKYAQYLRLDLDYRHYINLNEQSSLVFRAAGGLGKPLSNLKSLPFEKSFFAGGPNGIRAWKARTLGPGAFSNQSGFNEIGEMQLEGNIEYRFNIFKMLNAAAFIDAGNIWLTKPNINRSGGEFIWNMFADQIAIGAGLGARIDFGFFVLRLDLAIPLKDPAYPHGERWQFNKRPFERTNLNFGIGYPF